MLSDKLKEALPQLCMANLGKLDRGAVERRVDAAIALCVNNINQFPFRDGGKVESRKVTIELYITPELRETTVAIETNGGRQQEVKNFELKAISGRVKIKSGLPDAETGDVRMACDVRNGAIKDVRFNPDNNFAPEQLELDLEGDE